jgi:hypothetical protein
VIPILVVARIRLGFRPRFRIWVPFFAFLNVFVGGFKVIDIQIF